MRVEGSQQQVLVDADPNSLRSDSVWIHRFYDGAARTFDTPPQPYDIQSAARGLVDVIELVREKTLDHPPVQRDGLAAIRNAYVLGSARAYVQAAGPGIRGCAGVAGRGATGDSPVAGTYP